VVTWTGIVWFSKCNSFEFRDESSGSIKDSMSLDLTDANFY
jgi:hypothetical protein